MSIRSISQLLEDLRAQLTNKQISLDEILLAFHERGFGFFLFIFALPMALPLPVPPGINILLASPLLLLTAQQALGRKTIWMPKSFRRKTITKIKLNRMIDGALRWSARIELLIRPRLGFITQGAFSHLIGLLGFIMALTVCIPLPLTNTVPSLGIALMAIGVIMRDGLAVLSGAVIGTIWVSVLAYLTLTLGAEGIDLFKDTLKSFM